jgi:hypothetical protein
VLSRVEPRHCAVDTDRQLFVRLLKTHTVELLLNKCDLTCKVHLLAVGNASRLDRVYELKMSMWTQFGHKHSLTL